MSTRTSFVHRNLPRLLLQAREAVMAHTRPSLREHTLSDQQWRVLRVLGRGSEGVVYLARDTKLDREVAIKTNTLGQTADPMLANLLVSTAQTASRLSHPNIVTLHDAIESEGAHYLVLEYVEGETLAQLLRREGRVHLGHVDLYAQARFFGDLHKTLNDLQRVFGQTLAILPNPMSIDCCNFTWSRCSHMSKHG